jgi:hypothetical protein
MLLFTESFDHFTTQAAMLLGKWTSMSTSGGPIGAAYGRNSNGLLLLNVNAHATKNLAAAHATLICGFAFFYTGINANTDVVTFAEAAVDQQITVSLDAATRRLYVRRGATILATGTKILLANVSYYIEFKATIHNVTGAYELRIDEVTELTASGVNTRNATSNSADQLRLGNPYTSPGAWDFRYDDLYLCNDATARNNNFLGDVVIDCLVPNADGANSQWTPNAGAVHFDRVNQATPDDDTTFLSDATVNDRDTWAYSDLRAGAGTVLGMQLLPYVRKDDAGVRSVAPVIRIGGVNYDQATLPNLSTAYQYQPAIVEVSPATGVPFTLVEVNAAECGIKVIS